MDRDPDRGKLATILGDLGRALVVGVGGLLIVAGFLTFWLPIPIGLPLMLTGMAILMRYSRAARATMLPLARRWPWFRRLLRRVTVARQRPPASAQPGRCAGAPPAGKSQAGKPRRGGPDEA